MGRRAKNQVVYWASKGGYGAWVGGKQVMLAKGPDDQPAGPVFAAAVEKWVKLRNMEAGVGTDDYLVSALLNQYRLHLGQKRASGVPSTFDSLARSFRGLHGDRKVADLTPRMVEDWLEGQSAKWNPTSRHNAGRIVMTAVSWAKKRGLIKTNPLAGNVTLPPFTVRGREARMSDELCDLLQAEAYTNQQRNREFGDFLHLLRVTGARPIELRMAEGWNLRNGRITYRWNTTKGYVHKTAKKTQKDRVVYLPDGPVREQVEALARANPTGPIFRTPRGHVWTKQNLGERWQWLLLRPKVARYLAGHGIDRADMRMYNYRHTFISNWIDATTDIYTCALLCGTSVTMIERRYGHPCPDAIHGRLRAFYQRTMPFIG